MKNRFDLNRFDMMKKLGRDIFFQQHDLYKYVQYRNQLTPHIFWVADQAYRKLCLSKKSQCIAVSGESGAGMINHLFLWIFV